MKQTFTKIILGLLGLGLIGYIGRLWMQTGIIVTKNPVRSMGGLLLAGLIGIYICLLVAQPHFAPKSKRTLSLVGVVLLVVARLLYKDVPSAHIYLGDIVGLYAVVLIIGGAVGLFHDQKVIEARKMEEAEIIEV